MTDKKINLFVLGVQKCGTTSIADILNSQKDVFVPSIKETYFFCDENLFVKGSGWMHKEFYSTRPALQARFRVDATPFHLASTQALHRIAAYQDEDTKYIVILRNPVQRAVSAYLHQVRLGHENLSFEEALAAEPDRIKRASSEGGRWWRHAYVEVGMFGKHLSYARSILDEKNILVLWQDELNNVQYLNDRLSNFLQIQFSFSTTNKIHKNSASEPVSKTIRDIIIRDNALKSVARAIFPRELRTKIATKIRDLNLKTTEYEPIDKGTENYLHEVFRKDQALLGAQGFAPRRSRGVT